MGKLAAAARLPLPGDGEATADAERALWLVAASKGLVQLGPKAAPKPKAA